MQNRPDHATACLLLQDGTLFWGRGIGHIGETSGELCFNTSMTGYQEILTDPSYTQQIITFTFPHIGNTGINNDDMESRQITASGMIVRNDLTSPSNWRSTQSLDQWLKDNQKTAICGIDTRRLTQHLRDHGAQNGIIRYFGENAIDLDHLKQTLSDAPSMKGRDLAKTVSTAKIHHWCESGEFNVVVIDYGVKHNILRMLEAVGARVTLVPCTASAQDVLNLNPDGIFLSNGPGDPAATAVYAVPVILDLIKTDIPLFGICLGHQLLATALGGETKKLEYGHRGANHPVKNLETGQVEITSQNHGFVVVQGSLPDDVSETHVSLFDGSNEGLRHKIKPVFSVQHHPEASPGPQDASYVFEQFYNLIRQYSRKQDAA